MSFELTLLFDLDGEKWPKLIRTEFKYHSSQSQRDVRKASVRESERLKSTPSLNVFSWTPKDRAIRGFVLLCIRHFLSVNAGNDHFVLKGKAQFASSLGDAIGYNDPEERTQWLLAIVGVPKFCTGTGLRQLFYHSRQYEEVAFKEREAAGSEFRFILQGNDITDDNDFLAALAKSIEGDNEALSELIERKNSPPPPPLSLQIHLTGETFLCVRNPRTAKLLLERGLLPLPHNAAAQLHVYFDQPTHFLLYSFGSDGEVCPHVPQNNLPVGHARQQLRLPNDADPRAGKIDFDGPGGSESFLLLVSRRRLTAQNEKLIRQAVQRMVDRVGSIFLPDPKIPFIRDEDLFATKGLRPENKVPLSSAIDAFLEAIRSELGGGFSRFSFISVCRLDAHHPRTA
jgi:hypothetical protein